jgi:hypothetical protein
MPRDIESTTQNHQQTSQNTKTSLTLVSQQLIRFSAIAAMNMTDLLSVSGKLIRAEFKMLSTPTYASNPFLRTLAAFDQNLTATLGSILSLHMH